LDIAVLHVLVFLEYPEKISAPGFKILNRLQIYPREGRPCLPPSSLLPDQDLVPDAKDRAAWTIQERRGCAQFGEEAQAIDRLAGIQLRECGIAQPEDSDPKMSESKYRIWFS